VPTKTFKIMAQPDAPILVHPSQLRRIWRWGLDFLRASRPGPSWANTRHVLRLSLYSFESLKEIRAATGVQYDAVTGGALKVYPNQRGLR
jgi:D-amino-acid dehydrogenase